jgi:hypothetical protein
MRNRSGNASSSVQAFPDSVGGWEAKPMTDDTVRTVTRELEAEFAGQVDGDTLQAVVKARAQRFRDAPIQDYVPILVARDVRRSLLRRR